MKIQTRWPRFVTLLVVMKFAHPPFFIVPKTVQLFNFIRDYFETLKICDMDLGGTTISTLLLVLSTAYDDSCIIKHGKSLFYQNSKQQLSRVESLCREILVTCWTILIKFQHKIVSLQQWGRTLLENRQTTITITQYLHDG